MLMYMLTYKEASRLSFMALVTVGFGSFTIKGYCFRDTSQRSVRCVHATLAFL